MEHVTSDYPALSAVPARVATRANPAELSAEPRSSDLAPAPTRRAASPVASPADPSRRCHSVWRGRSLVDFRGEEHVCHESPVGLLGPWLSRVPLVRFHV